MWKNYFKTAWRNIVRNKVYSSLNILGLATGMAVALLIGLWVHNEYSYDTFLPNFQRVYQVRRNFNSNNEILNFTSTSLKLAEALRNQVPEIEYVAESDSRGSHGLVVGDKKLFMKGMQINGDFLKMFGYPLVAGSAQSAMQDPYSIVLTEATAKALFGAIDPVNKMVRYDNKNNLRVTAILKDIPQNSSLQFDFIVPFSYYELISPWVKEQRTGSYGNNAYQIYTTLKPGVSYAQVAPKIRDIEKTEKNSFNAMHSEVILQPMKEWHLFAEYKNGVAAGGFIDYVNMFGLIGILVLLIACINFINLTTARSEKRAREVGVRKAVGSMRSDLVIQFLAESFFLCLLAFIFSVLFVQLALPAFNSLTGNKITIPYGSIQFWSIAMVCVMVTALVAGSRPAFFLSSFNTVSVLKGTLKFSKGAALPRKVLVVMQFTCSIALIISTIIIYRQIGHAKDRPTGYNKDRLLMTEMNGDLETNYPAFKNELVQNGIAESVTVASSPATGIYWHSDVDHWPGKNAGETIEMGTIIVAEDYFKTLGFTNAEGRDFLNTYDTTSVIFNEAAIRQMRIKEPVSKVITWNDKKYHIVGVAKDALMASPYAAPEPTMFFCNPETQSNLMYRLSPGIKTQAAIDRITAIFNKYSPAYPYSYKFADTEYAKKFKVEVLIGKLAGIFAGLAIFISSLGLFGLAAFVAEQRTKEIGIRKVLGATVSQVWLLLSKDFILLVFLSCVIATPVALYFLQGWLQKYSYRVTIGAGVFILAAVMALAITLITISFQAIKAAMANPVRSLRTE